LGEPESSRGAVDLGGRAFEFEKDPDGCFIEVQMKTTEPEAGAIFVVSKRGSQAQGPKCPRPVLGPIDHYLAFQAFFVMWRGTGSGPYGQRAFERQNHGWPSRAGPGISSRALDAQAQQSPRTSDLGAGRVVERILLEYAAERNGAEIAQLWQDGADFRDAELDLDFELDAAVSGHGSV